MGGLILSLERVLPADRRTVFAAFTDPGDLSRWWGPVGFTIPSVQFDARPGGEYRIEMQPPGGDAFHLTGRIHAVEPPSRLAYTFVWEPPDPDDVATLVDLSFSERAGRTTVVLTQGEFTTEDRRELHRGGWTESLAKVETWLAELSPRRPGPRP